MAVHHDRYAPVGKKATNPGTHFGREAVRWKFIKKCGMPNLIKGLRYNKGNNPGFNNMKFKRPGTRSVNESRYVSNVIKSPKWRSVVFGAVF